MLIQRVRATLLVLLATFSGTTRLSSAAPDAPPSSKDLFAKDNLVAWCIVPYDGKKRSPEDRAAMLEKLGLKKFAYDWRAEHLPTFDTELDALKRHGIELSAVWFPSSLNSDARVILDTLKKHQLKTQLWVGVSGSPIKGETDQVKLVAASAERLKPIVHEAAKQGCTVGVYNHGGWAGEPENMVAVLKALNLANVGLVYNLHHGHDHLDRLPEVLALLKPHLYCININGMTKAGDKQGKKILPLGSGDLDVQALKSLRESGYDGAIGILNHTNEDAERRLQDNLDGLARLIPQLEGNPVGRGPAPHE